MYNPDSSNTGGEFVEIYNRGTTSVDLAGWRLVDSSQVMFILPGGTTIEAGGYLVFYDDVEAVAYYGLDLNISYGPYTGGLSGDGELIQLQNSSAVVVDEVLYDDNWPWPPQPDGDGPSLELIDSAGDNNDPANWGVGQPYSPGQMNDPTLWGDGDIVISELMYHPGSTNWGGEFIELYNRSVGTIDLSNWYLDAGVYYTIPNGTTLAAGAYLVIAGDPNVPVYYDLVPASVLGPYTGKMSNSGDLVVLRDSGGAVVTVVNYNDQVPWPMEADGFGPSLELIDLNGDNNNPVNWGIGQPYTPGGENAPAFSGGGDLVITEIMYQPAKGRYLQSIDPLWGDRSFWNEGDDSSGEFIELYNRSSSTVDLSNWELVDEDGLLYEFLPGTSLNQSSYLVVCSDATAIASRFAITNVVGNFTTAGNRLSDGGERITLVNSNGVVVDVVRYNDSPPWPIAPDQNGVSLECMDPLSDNSQAANWRAYRGLYTQTTVGIDTFLNRGSPGNTNSVIFSGLPPFVDISDFEHSPKRPTSSDIVTIAAEVTGNETIADVTLYYEVYTAPYQSPTQTASVTMYDDGTNGDEIAGDGIYGALIPAKASQTLVRYKVTAEDVFGRSWTYPDSVEPNPNRAYFVYNGEEETNLPAYFLIVPQSTLNALNADIWTHEYFDATLVVEGIVYDHVGIHYRGRGWRSHPKKSWKVAFNKTEYLRDMSRLDLAMHFPVLQKIVNDLFWSMGHGSLASEPVRLYTMKDGVFGLYGLMLAQESPNTSWLKRHDYDDTGEVYKASCAPSYGGCPSWSGTYIADLDYYSDLSLYPKMYEKKGDPLGPFDTLIDLCDKVTNTSEANVYTILAKNIDVDVYFRTFKKMLI